MIDLIALVAWVAADETSLASPGHRPARRAVVRADVRYRDPVRQEYRDLWMLRFDQDGRCSWWEEWGQN